MPFLVNLSLFFAPAMIILMYLYFRRHKDAGFLSLMIRSVIFGAISVMLLIISLYISYAMGIYELKSLKRTLFFSFITSAGASELGKFVFYRYVIMKRKVSATPSDAILLSITTALGFCLAALPLVVFNVFSVQQSLPVTLFVLSYIPANLIFSVVMGFFIGMAKLLRTTFVYSFTGLAGAAIFHGIFTFCMVTRDYRLLSLFAFGSLVIVFILAMKAAFTTPESVQSNE